MKKLKIIILLTILFNINPSFAIDYNCYIKQGQTQFNNKQYNEALISFKKAATLKGSDYRLYQIIGAVYLEKKDYSQAVAYLQKASNLNPNDKYVKNALINAYFLNKNYDKVIENLGAKNNLPDSQTYNTLALSYINKNDLDNAQKVLNTALIKYPTDEILLNNLSYILNVKKDYINYKKNLEKILLISSNKGEVYKKLGYTSMQLNDDTSALKNFENAIKYGISDANMYYNLGIFYYREKKYTQSLKAINKALTLNPNIDNENKLLEKLDFLCQIEKFSNTKIQKPTEKAPVKLYKLVKFKKNTDENLANIADEILDYIWSDEQGKILLNLLMKQKTPIQIIHANDKRANALVTTTENRQSISFGNDRFNDLEISSFKTQDIKINISDEYLNDFTSDDFLKKFTTIKTFVHEICHAISNDINEQKNNSKQEELIADMIGSNIAFRILLNREINANEAKYLSTKSYEAIMSDDHKLLPDNNHFDIFIMQQGINLPHYNVYRSIFLKGTPQNEVNYIDSNIIQINK